MFFLFFLFVNLQAQPVTNTQAIKNLEKTINKNYIFEQREKEELKRLKQNKEINARKPFIKQKKLKQPIPLVKPKHCTKIEKIIVKGNTKFSLKEQKKILKDFYNTCLSPKTIDLIIHTITNWYISNGFVTSRVYIPQQNIKSGSLILVVLEGKLDSIKQNKNKFLDKTESYMSFPISKGEIINIRDIEQGLDRLNRLQSNNATTKMLPGNKEGTTTIEVINNKSNPFTVYFGIDNSVPQKVRSTTSLSYDNFLHLADNWNFRYSAPIAKDKTENVNYSTSLSIPFGYWLFSFSNSISRSLSYLYFSNLPYSYKSNILSNNFTASYRLYKGKTASLDTNVSLGYQDRKTFFADELLEVSSRSNANMSLGLNFSDKFTRGFYSLGIAYKNGLTGIFNVTDAINNDDLPDGYPITRYQKYSLNGSVCYYLNFWGAKYCTNGSLQYAPHTLFAEEQISISDKYSVRGFAQASFVGDTGFYLRNEFTVPLSKFLSYKNIIVPSFLFAIDLGFADKTGTKDLNGAYDNLGLAGLSFGLKNNSDYFNFSLVCSVPIIQPKIIWEQEGNNFELYADLTIRLW